MSILDLATAPVAAHQRRPFWRPATILWSLAAVIVLLVLALHVIDGGYVRRDIEQLQAGEAWRTGGWLSQVVLRVVGLLPGTQLQQWALSLTVVAVSGFAFGALYDRLRANGWFRIGAFIALVALMLHAGGLYTVTASSRAIPLYIAFAALIPAIRSLEDVGDVQSAIGLGLLLPLLLLASPIAALLIVPLAIATALADRDARTDPRAFVAMLLVAILPTLIVAIGIVGFIVQARMDVAAALLPYVSTYTNLHFDVEALAGGLEALAVFAPVLIVPLLYCFWPELPERRHVFSALAVIALPLYLVFARTILNTTMTAIVPPIALIVAFLSWLAVVRLPFQLRLLSLLLLVLAAAASWTYSDLWNDAAWKAALFNQVPAGIAQLSLRSGV
ncbi:hypothetical protein ASC89_05685 [Devosia sp. Root413D1]|uniref:hypothetical protein n=1 Tax=unclassified Devosia TaxID=196773 RepID=UPI0006FBF36D|nr:MULTISPECIES: hypothetical protein [unclassified Devosia]KQU99094.1 hypothetical protein ASC68_06835 [Devosia sp. Root105]KQW81311.1 hypothetical protein ASC89_05685 [Devosia sp. Root413D1]